jgi:3-oxoacyl-[acyl-carrier-protein] synthase-3
MLQDAAGLPKQTVAFDLSLGCSGFPYGMAVAGSMLRSLGLHRAALVMGEIIDRENTQQDYSVRPLFGEAVSLVLLENPAAPSGAPAADRLPWYLNLATDGSGYQAIYQPAGGSRQPMSAEALAPQPHGEQGQRVPAAIWLDGNAVFQFGLREVKPSVRALLSEAGYTWADIDFWVMHQANRMLNETIRKQLGVPREQVPYSLQAFGNTSSASIPLTIVTQLRSVLAQQRATILNTGFGVGLSWGNLLCELGPEVTILPLQTYQPPPSLAEARR